MSALLIVLALVVAFWLGGLYRKSKSELEQVRIQACIDFDAARRTLLRWYADQDDPVLLESAKIVLAMHNQRRQNASLLPILKTSPLESEYLKAYGLLVERDENDSYPTAPGGPRQEEALEFAYARAECWKVMTSDLSTSRG